MSVFLYFEGLETRIGVLEGLVHVVWGESVSFNLCEYEIFCHFEQGLGHGIFLGIGDWKAQPFFGLDHGVGHFRPLSITQQRHLLAYHGIAMSCEGLCQVF